MPVPAVDAGAVSVPLTESGELARVDPSGFASIAYGDGAAWFTNYDRGTLTKVSG